MKRDNESLHLTYNVTDGHWLFSDPGFSVLTSPGGVLVDHNCDGVSDVAVGPGSNFYPGLQVTPCNVCPDLTPTHSIVETLWQSLNCRLHSVYPLQAEEADPCTANLDGNGNVGLSDLGAMKTEFGRFDCTGANPPCVF